MAMLTPLQAKLVLTTAVPLTNLFLSNSELKESLSSNVPDSSPNNTDLPDSMRNLMDDLGLSMSALKSSSIFSGDEERFAFARALSRLVEMGSAEWVERGLGLGVSELEGKEDREAWRKVRSRWREDSM
jgi:protein AFG1